MNNINYNDYKKFCSFYKRRVNLVATLRLISFFLVIICLLCTNNNGIFYFFGGIFAFLFIILIFIHDIYYKKLDYYNKFLDILDEYNARKCSKWRSFKDTGSEFSSQLFSDLNIVGNNSLFQYLNVAVSCGGRKKLINRFSNKKISNKNILDLQECIKELSNDNLFLVDFQVYMREFKGKDVDFIKDISIFKKGIVVKKYNLFFALFFSLFSILFLFLSLLKIISFKWFYFVFITNFLINYMYSYIYNSEFDDIESVSFNISKLYFVFKRVISCNYSSKLFNKYKKDIKMALSDIDKLIVINNLSTLKNNILSSFIFNGLFCINIFVMALYSRFKKNNIDSIIHSLGDIENLEALVSLAGLGAIRNDVCMPSVSDNIELKFTDLKYPLLSEDKYIGNDFSTKSDVNVITGSNMGGKTSFLRTIGINLILMNAGGFVCASNFSSSYLKIFTSLDVSDDISNGISTFYGELLRVKDAIDYNDGYKIVLIDEIFKGTNYQDRLFGAKKVIEKLNNNDTIVFITTHDFELCDIRDNNVFNYNFSEYYEGDNIKFDYKIKKGKCNSTNAKYLMKKLNIID